jgi:site-specific DNA recombinase
MMRALGAVPDRPGRAVIYRRVSALMGRGGDDFHSPDLQAAAVRRHLGPLGLREVGVVDDIDVTGRTFAREGLDTIRGMVVDGKVDVIAVYDLSRLGRNAGEALRFIKWLRDHGVSIISTVEKIDDTPEGQFILGQFLLLAEMYSNQLGRRWSELIAHRARAGKAHGAVLPIGYHRDAGKIAVDPVLGPIVQEVFRAYADGVSASSLCRKLAAARGKPTRIQQVKRMLTNPFYLGKVALWGNRTRSSTTKPTLLVDGEHPALVDEAVWDLVQERVRQQSRTPPRLLAVSHELVSLAWCAHCQQRLQRHDAPERGKRTARLRCGQVAARAGGCKGCGAPRIDEVIQVVLRRLRQRVREIREDATAALLVESERTRANVDTGAIERELGETRRAATRVTDGWARGLVPEEQYRELTEVYREQEAALQGRLDDLKRVTARPEAAAYATLVEKLLALWPRMDIEQRNRALKDAILRVVIRRSERWREPVDDRVEVQFA